MKKLSSTFFLCLIFLLFSSCAPDLTDDVEWAYDVAKNNSGSGSGSSSGSCTTIDGNIWSPKASSTMSWSDAIDYCNNLTACGYSDWHLPNINELRTLIKNCPGSQTGGSCAVKDPGCLSSDCWSEDCYCEYRENNGGYYSKLGDDDNVWLWSSSTNSDSTGSAWRVNFYYGSVGSNSKSYDLIVRCVR